MDELFPRLIGSPKSSAITESVILVTEGRAGDPFSPQLSRDANECAMPGGAAPLAWEGKNGTRWRRPAGGQY